MLKVVAICNSYPLSQVLHSVTKPACEEEAKTFSCQQENHRQTPTLQNGIIFLQTYPQ